MQKQDKTLVIHLQSASAVCPVKLGYNNKVGETKHKWMRDVHENIEVQETKNTKFHIKLESYLVLERFPYKQIPCR